MNLRIQNQAQISDKHPHRSENEDLVFSLDDLTVLMDGATGLNKQDEKIEFSANQFTRMVESELRKTWDPSKGFEVSLGLALQKVRRASESMLTNIRSAYLLPSAGLVSFHMRKSVGYFYRIGDCSCLLSRKGRIFNPFGKSRLETLDRDVVDYISDRIKGESNSVQARKDGLTMLRQNRSRMNTLDGYGALTPEPSCLSYLESIEWELEAGDLILLASDGFMAMSNLYGLNATDDFFIDSSNESFAKLVQRMREVEHRDRKLIRFPRIKQFDDASAILMRITSEAN